MTAKIETERAIERVLHSVAYILDAGEYERMGEVFHADVLFSNPGRLEAQGLDTLISAFSAIANPARSHANTNIVVTVVDDAHATSICKAHTVRADGEVAPAEYRDALVLTDAGWRIAERRIRPL
jgi:ketosteroid isomerase-like protein